MLVSASNERSVCVHLFKVSKMCFVLARALTQMFMKVRESEREGERERGREGEEGRKRRKKTLNWFLPAP